LDSAYLARDEISRRIDAVLIKYQVATIRRLTAETGSYLFVSSGGALDWFNTSSNIIHCRWMQRMNVDARHCIMVRYGQAGGLIDAREVRPRGDLDEDRAGTQRPKIHS
jgi:hypothetical protein